MLPGTSEATLLALLTTAEQPQLVLLWSVATLGNTLGAAVNWVLGIYVRHFEHRRWFPFSARQRQRAEHWFKRYGVWCLLLSWLPIAGDALTFAAGLSRTNFWLFLGLTTIGKGSRYAAVILIAT